MYQEYFKAKKELAHAKANLLAQEALIFTRHKDKLTSDGEGSTKITDGSWQVKITQKLNRTIDQKGAEQLGGLGLKAKYAWSKTEYAKLDDNQKKIVNAVITTKPGKPSFEIKENLNADE